MFRRRMGQGSAAGPEQQPGVGPNVYKMREKLLSIGDDSYIENGQGERPFYVDGKALRLRNTLILKDSQGNELYSIQERMLRVKDTMEIEHDGQTAATIKKAIISPLRQRYTVSIPGGEDLTIQGNILDHEYAIEHGRGNPAAQVSKKWFRIRDTYGVEVSPGEDAALILAIVAAMDIMSR